MTRYYYRCPGCGASFSSPKVLEVCQNIPKGRPCRTRLTLERQAKR